MIDRRFETRCLGMALTLLAATACSPIVPGPEKDTTPVTATPLPGRELSPLATLVTANSDILIPDAWKQIIPAANDPLLRWSQARIRQGFRLALADYGPDALCRAGRAGSRLRILPDEQSSEHWSPWLRWGEPEPCQYGIRTLKDHEILSEWMVLYRDFQGTRPVKIRLFVARFIAKEDYMYVSPANPTSVSTWGAN